MRLSTSQFFQRSNSQIATLAGRAGDLQSQIASGKRLAQPSDDAAAYLRLRGLKLDGANDAASAANLKLATSALAQADTTLTAMTQQLQRASELTIQARNGTLTAADRVTIGEEMASIVTALTELANTRDLRGEYIFGGADGSPAVTTDEDGAYVFATTTGAPIPTGETSSVQPGEPAERLLKAGDTDMLTLIGTLAAALTDGTATDEAMGEAIDGIAAASDGIATTQGILGARAARVDVQTALLKDAGLTREEARSGIEDTDVTEAVVELQKTMTILQATQASFSKLASLSLFDYLR